jgi:hypothetical protein
MSDETITFETYWVGGHGAQDRAKNLTNAVDEALHTLNYATMAGHGGAEAPIQIWEHLGSLQNGTSLLPQSLTQMAARLESMDQNGTLRLAVPGDPAEAAAKTIEALNAAARAAEQLAAALARAQGACSNLKLDKQTGVAVGRAYGDPNDYDFDDENED